MARQLPLHPLGLALSPALTLYASNPEAIRPVELVAPLAIWLAGVVGFGLLVWLWLRDVGASAVLASVAALLTGGFGSARRLAGSFMVRWTGPCVLLAADLLRASRTLSFEQPERISPRLKGAGQGAPREPRGGECE